MRNVLAIVIFCALAAAGAVWFSGTSGESGTAETATDQAAGEGGDAALEACDSCAARHQRLDRDRSTDE